MSIVPVLKVEEIDDRIREWLQAIARKGYSSFRCAGAILYLEDPFSASLEPVFMAPERAYGERAVLTDEQAKGSSLASLAYRNKQTEFSNDPDRDSRLTPETLRIRAAYGIRGAMIALPVQEPISGRQLGVLLIYASHKNSGPDPVKAAEEINADAQQLSPLLLLRERILTAETAKNYAEFTQHILRQLRPICTSDIAARRFAASCKQYLRVKYMHIQACFTDPHQPDQEPVLETNLDGDISPLLRLVLSRLRDHNPYVLNRPERDPDFSAAIPPQRDVCMWACLHLRDSDTEVICLLGRPIGDFVDHWMPSDITFLNQSAQMFQEVLKRSGEFARALKRVKADQNQAGSDQPHFDFICHIFKEFLGIDQVMVTRVTREPRRYRIKGELARGFAGDICRLTDRELNRAGRSEADKLDVLPYILDEFLKATSAGRSGQDIRQIYPAVVGESAEGFVLDPKVVTDCHLRGKIYYLLCISRDQVGTPTLRGILHLGNSQGRLDLPDDVLPYLKTFADRIAERLAAEEQERIKEQLRTIQAVNKPVQPLLQEIMKAVSGACHALGCTLFLRSTLLHLIGWRDISLDNLEFSVRQFLIKSRNLSWWQTNKHAVPVRRMLCAFLGVTEGEFDELFMHLNLYELAKLVSRFLYIRVAQTQFEPKPDRLRLHMIDCRREDDPTLVDRVATFLREDCYLPGYGLTGWVMRYRRAIRLADKQSQTIGAFFEQVRPVMTEPFVTEVLHFANLNSFESCFRLEPFREPVHADHVSEGVESQRDDTYLACPLDAIDEPYACSGVLRVSSSANLRRHFDATDEMTVTTAAMHLSLLLLREFTRQQNYLRSQLDQVALEEDLGHVAKNLAAQIPKLQQILQFLPDDTMVEGEFLPMVEEVDEEKKESLADIGDSLLKLRRLCYRAVHAEKMRDQVRRQSQFYDSDDALELIERSLRSWFVATNHHFPVIRDPHSPQIPITDLTTVRICLVVDEVVTNALKHGSVNHLEIVIGGREDLMIQVIEGPPERRPNGLLMDLANITLHPYEELLGEGERGGGSQLFENVRRNLPLKISYGCLDKHHKIYVVNFDHPTQERRGRHAQDESSLCRR